MTTSSNALTEIIRKKIAEQGGQISFADFMELALYHPDFGYYTAKGFDLGIHGDFTTAPEISPLFASCFAKQCQQIFTHMHGGNILELGAGTGRFAGDLLRELDRLDCLPEYYFIYEISAELRKKQQFYLQSQHPLLYPRCVWLHTLPQEFVGIMIANEVLDALPVTCFRVENTGIKERAVAFENQQFVWRLIEPITAELHEKSTKLRENYGLKIGYESEINLHLPAFIAALASSLKHGVILLADYGYGESEYYHPERRKGTLTCFCEHRHHDDPLILVGQQDITAHVDFTNVAENAVANGCSLLGYTTQTAFLLSLGLLEFAAEKEQHLSPAETFKLHQSIKTLTLPTEMGERIKVMALGKEVDFSLLGFEMVDRRRDLPPDSY